MANRLDALPKVEVTTRAQWRAWLAKNHSKSPGVWVVTFKRETGRPRPTYDDLAEEALCFGWVDSLPRSLDAERGMLLVTPRKPRSAWSAKNKARAERLIAEKRMAPAGLAAIERARASGRWNALDEVETLAIPADLKKALEGFPHARAHFEAFPRSVRRAILEWISGAKKPETRAARIAETARLAEDDVRANQWRQPKGVRAKRG